MSNLQTQEEAPNCRAHTQPLSGCHHLEHSAALDLQAEISVIYKLLDYQPTDIVKHLEGHYSCETVSHIVYKFVASAHTGDTAPAFPNLCV